MAHIILKGLNKLLVFNCVFQNTPEKPQIHELKLMTFIELWYYSGWYVSPINILTSFRLGVFSNYTEAAIKSVGKAMSEFE